MCQFFSLVSAGDGKPLYFDAKLRKKLKGKYEPDSHTSIADYFGYKAEKEDTLNKYEYNPFTKVFKIDQKNNPKDDSEQIKKFCLDLDFKKIIPQLNLHPIINPFKDFQVKEVTQNDLKLLKKWDSVGASVWDSVWASVWASVGDSVGDSVRASVGDSVRASVWASVGDSVGASVWAYTATFVDTKYKYNLKPAQELWNKGLVGSFDGNAWRLHGANGKVLKEITREELKKIR
jgi:hypothetical protein